MKRSSIMLVALLCAGCSGSSEVNPGKVIYAGVRSSSYGISPFPEPKAWGTAVGKMAGFFEGAAPSAIWIVGVAKGPRSISLEFPGDAASNPNMAFAADDKHERYLAAFDAAGIKVFLQVEPEHADVGTLIDLVLARYKQHPCVVGFGVDVEWYQEDDNPGHGAKIDDSTAKAWEARVKAHKADYRLMLKHWDPLWMPPTYRGDIVFVDDSQGFAGLSEMVEELSSVWARTFAPNRVLFQVGYDADRPWWSALRDPPRAIGEGLRARVPQDLGIIWVDFTLKEVLPLD
jgi:hypothetical protein